MKETGIVRNIDVLGRIVIPKEIREVLDIDIKDPLEIYIDDNSIYLKKYNSGCMFCENAKNVVRFKDKIICRECLNKLSK